MYQDNTKKAEKLIENTQEITDIAYTSVNNLFRSVVEQLPYFISGILVIVFFYIVARLGKAIFLKVSKRTALDTRLRTLFSRLLVVFIFVLGIFAALTVIIPKFSFGDLIAGLGFTSFIVGFATKDILNNLLSGVLILWKEPFKIGDYLFVKDMEGKVEYIGVRASHLRMDDGELILIPNGEMYSNALIIRRAGTKRRIKLKISIGYNSNIRRAKEIIQEVLKEAVGVANEPQPNVYVNDLNADGVSLTMVFWIDTEKDSPIKVFDGVAIAIEEQFEKEEIKLYP